MENNTLAFDKLPAETQSKLIELQNSASDHFVFVPKLSGFYWLAIVAGVIWIAYLFSSTQAYLWEYWMFWLLLAGSIFFIPLSLYAAFAIVSSKFSKLKDGYVFTANECIKTKGNLVEFWGLKELEGFQFREDIKTIEVWIGKRLEKIKAPNTDDAGKLHERFVEIRNNAGESFLRPFAKPELAYNGSAKFAKLCISLTIVVALATGASYAAKIMNRNYDDSRTWERIQNGTTVADFEEYKQRHPDGNHKAENDQKIGAIFGRLKDDYVKKAKKDADPVAVSALSEILDRSGIAANRNIYVQVKESRDLDDAVVKKMRQLTGFQIANYDYSVPVAEEAFRKDKLSKDLGLAFLPATRPASINFEMTDNPPAETTVIDINYTARSVENFYRYVWYSNGNLTTFYKPAAKFEFEMTVRGPDSRELYKTSYISLFSDLQSTGIVDSRDSANYSFDKMYFTSVSDDFTKYIGRQFGFIE